MKLIAFECQENLNYGEYSFSDYPVFLLSGSTGKYLSDHVSPSNFIVYYQLGVPQVHMSPFSGAY